MASATSARMRIVSQFLTERNMQVGRARRARAS